MCSRPLDNSHFRDKFFQAVCDTDTGSQTPYNQEKICNGVIIKQTKEK